MRHLFAIIISLLSLSAGAQSLGVDSEVLNWESGAMAGFNNDGYEWEFRATYFRLPYLGLKVGLGLAGEIKQVEDWGEDEWETGHHYATRFKFNPAIVLRTPRLIHWKSPGAGFYLFAEPGMVLSPGAKGSRVARVCCWDLKTGINCQVDRYIVFIGYGVSNFSLYSGRPDSFQGLPERNNYITHTAFIGFAGKF